MLMDSSQWGLYRCKRGVDEIVQDSARQTIESDHIANDVFAAGGVAEDR